MYWILYIFCFLGLIISKIKKELNNVPCYYYINYIVIMSSYLSSKLVAGTRTHYLGQCSVLLCGFKNKSHNLWTTFTFMLMLYSVVVYWCSYFYFIEYWAADVIFITIHNWMFLHLFWNLFGDIFYQSFYYAHVHYYCCTCVVWHIVLWYTNTKYVKLRLKFHSKF